MLECHPIANSQTLASDNCMWHNHIATCSPCDLCMHYIVSNHVQLSFLQMIAKLQDTTLKHFLCLMFWMDLLCYAWPLLSVLQYD